MIKVIIFDLDGTLVDTVGGIGHACNTVLEKEGYEIHPIDRYKAFVGNGLEMTIYRALPKEVQEEISSIYIDDLKSEPDFSHEKLAKYVKELIKYYEENPVAETNIYSGVEALLKALKVRDIKWGIHTNKTHAIALKVAEAFFDADDYLGLIGPNDDIPRKPHPQGSIELISRINETVAMDEVLFVGDTEVDIETAKNLGVKVAAVGWGFREEAFLKALKPDFLVKHPREIVELLEEC